MVIIIVYPLRVERDNIPVNSVYHMFLGMFTGSVSMACNISKGIGPIESFIYSKTLLSTYSTHITYY